MRFYSSQHRIKKLETPQTPMSPSFLVSLEVQEIGIPMYLVSSFFCHSVAGTCPTAVQTKGQSLLIKFHQHGSFKWGDLRKQISSLEWPIPTHFYPRCSCHLPLDFVQAITDNDALHPVVKISQIEYGAFFSAFLASFRVLIVVFCHLITQALLAVSWFFFCMFTVPIYTLKLTLQTIY